MNRVALILTALCIVFSAGTCFANGGGPDAFGYQFVDNQGGDSASFAWIELCGDPNAISGPTGHNNVSCFSWGWNFPFYGTNYTSGCFSTNGLMTMLGANSSGANLCGLSGMEPPWPTLYPYWDDLRAAAVGGCVEAAGPWLLYRDFGSSLVLEWKRIQHNVNSNDRYSFEAILFPDGRIKFQYDMDWIAPDNPISATIGVDAPGAGNGLEYLCNGVPASNIVGPGRAAWFYVQVSTGRCCYGNNQCADNTLAECNSLSGAWTQGLTCAGNPCPDLLCCPQNPESEPNHDFLNADPLPILGSTGCAQGIIADSSDVDLFFFTVGQTSRVILDVHGTDDPASCAYQGGLDAAVGLQIVVEDTCYIIGGTTAGGVGRDPSYESPFCLDPGVYYAAVRHDHTAPLSAGPYVLTVTLLPSLPVSIAPPVLTLKFVADSAHLLAHWIPVPEATAYRLESSDTPDGPWQGIATTDNNEVVFLPDSPAGKQFYRVIGTAPLNQCNTIQDFVGKRTYVPDDPDRIYPCRIDSVMMTSFGDGEAEIAYLKTTFLEGIPPGYMSPIVIYDARERLYAAGGRNVITLDGLNMQFTGNVEHLHFARVTADFTGAYQIAPRVSTLAAFTAATLPAHIAGQPCRNKTRDICELRPGQACPPDGAPANCLAAVCAWRVVAVIFFKCECLGPLDLNCENSASRCRKNWEIIECANFSCAAPNLCHKDLDIDWWELISGDNCDCD